MCPQNLVSVYTQRWLWILGAIYVLHHTPLKASWGPLDSGCRAVRLRRCGATSASTELFLPVAVLWDPPGSGLAPAATLGVALPGYPSKSTARH